MADDRDAFGNPIGDFADAPSSTPAPAPAEAAPMARHDPGPQAAPPPVPPRRSRRRSRGLLVLIPGLLRLVVIGLFLTAGFLIVRSAGDVIGDVSSSVSDLTETVGTPEPTAPGQAAVSADYSRTPFAKGSMFRGDNLARATARAQKAAPPGARAVGMSVFPGYVVVTFKRRNGAATTVTAWAGGRTVATDTGAVAGHSTFPLSRLPLQPMVRYVRARDKALGRHARGPYAVLTDIVTTTFARGQVKVSTRPAAGWLIGFEGVRTDQRTVRIDLHGRRVR